MSGSMHGAELTVADPARKAQIIFSRRLGGGSHDFKFSSCLSRGKCGDEIDFVWFSLVQYVTHYNAIITS